MKHIKQFILKFRWYLLQNPQIEKQHFDQML